MSSNRSILVRSPSRRDAALARQVRAHESMVQTRLTDGRRVWLEPTTSEP